MVEFRTTPPGKGNTEGDSDWLEGALKQAYQNIQNDPESQARIAVAVNQNYGLPMDLLVPALPKMGEGLTHLESQEDQTGRVPNEQIDENMKLPNDPDATEKPVPTPEPKTKTKKPTHDELTDFISEIIEYVGDDFTLGELRVWATENPDMVNTAIQLKF